MRFHIRFHFLFLVIILNIPGTALAQKKAGKSIPQWIWHDRAGGLPPKTEIIRIRRVFTLSEGKIESAELKIAADDSAAVYINGQLIGDKISVRNRTGTGPKNRGETHDITRLLKPGENVIATQVSNRGGPAGLLVQLKTITEDGVNGRLISDSDWVTLEVNADSADGAKKDATPIWAKINFDDSAWRHARKIAEEGDNPWFQVLTPPSVATGESLKLLPGFKAEVLRIAKPDEDTWVSMTIDDRGRLIVSSQHAPTEEWGGLLRFTLSSGDGSIAKEERIELPVGSAQGLAYGHNSLYLNGEGPEGFGMYRLRDTDRDDQYDKVEFLKKLYNRGGSHGPHGIAIGPDGWIYHISGDYSKTVDDLDPDSLYQNYLEDLLLPRHWDATGHGRGIMAPSGHVQRFTPDGKTWQLYCGGMRNPYGLAFNRDGELFTYDADMEYDVGLPWYRPTRVYHLVPGGEYGQRAGTGKWPYYYPDSLAPVTDIGLGSPCGIKFGYASHFPKKYQNALYMSDWAWGKIYAVHLTEDGATYAGKPEVFAEGKPLNAMDIEFAADGSMYLITGGNDSQAALYRIFHENPKSITAITSSRSGSGSVARQRRRKIEALAENNAPPKPTEIKALISDLSSGRSISFATRTVLERLAPATWHSYFLDPQKVRLTGNAIADVESNNILINGLLAVARTGSPQDLPALLNALDRIDWETLPRSRKLALLRVYQVTLTRLGPTDKTMRTLLTKKFDAFYPAKAKAQTRGSGAKAFDFDLNRELSQLLVYLEAPTVIEKTLNLIETSDKQEEEIWFTFVLRTLPSGRTLDQRKRYLAWYDHAAANYKGGVSFYKYLSNFKQDALATLTFDEKLHSDLEPYLADIALPAPLAPKKVLQPINSWTLSDIEPHLGEVARSNGRNFEKGKEAFRNAQCGICHRVFSEGGAIGPDLTAVANRFSQRDILEAIIDPNKTVMAQYENTTITLKDGKEIIGRVIEENDKTLVLITDATAQIHAEVAKSDIAKQSVSNVSPMPPGLLNVLTKEELLDLLAYLQSGGVSGAAVFK